MRRSSLDKVRESLRLQQVYNLLLSYSWDFLFERWGLLGDLRHAMQRWVWQLPPDLELLSTPVKVRLLLEELGPTYVKMGQIVSSQAAVIPAEWDAELVKLQSDVPPFPTTQVREIIAEELGAPPEELYASFEPTPFAAASTAQVHRATLYEGQEVAVKVQRPGIQSQMKADIGIMQSASRVISGRSDYVRAIDLEGMVKEFGDNVLAELDYTGEAYNAFRLSQNMASIEGVHIPAVYPALSTPRVLTMQFIRGVKITDLEAIDAAGLDRSKLGRTTLRAMVKQLLIDGFFHADPHPGNLMVDLETGDLNFLDTGMVGQLDLNQRMNIVQLLIALQRKDVTAMAQIMRDLSVPFMGEVNDKAYFRDFERRIGRYMHAEAGSGTGFGESFNVALDVLRENGLRLNPELTMAVKALMQTDAVSTLLYPEGGIVRDGMEMVKDMAIEEITADRILDVASKQLMLSGREVIKRLPSLQEATVKWLDQYQKGRFEVYVDTSGLAKEIDKLGKLGQQIVIVIMLVGMIIGSAIVTTVIALSDVVGDLWLFLFRMAYLGYIIPMVVALIIVFRLVWHWLRGKEATED